MLCEFSILLNSDRLDGVLILVVMEYALRGDTIETTVDAYFPVLILGVMEYALRGL